MSRQSRRAILRAGIAALFITPAILTPGTVHAQSGPDPVTIITTFYNILLDIMNRGSELGYAGRYEIVAPALDETFDLVTMCKIAVGPDWTPMSGEEKTALLRAFSIYMVGTYAARFKIFKGEQFKVGAASPVGEDRVLVATQIIKANGEPVDLNYLFRLHEGAWRVIDIYLSGTISEMARMRSDFAQSLQQGGAGALVAELEKKIAELEIEK
jgi:phospholipid transport system substrate-binding protein